MTAARRPLIAGNWKMNGLAADGLALARSLAAATEGAACTRVPTMGLPLPLPTVAAQSASALDQGMSEPRQATPTWSNSRRLTCSTSSGASAA